MMSWIIYALAAWKGIDIARGIYRFVRDVVFAKPDDHSINDYTPRF